MAGSAAPRLPHEGKAPRDLTHARRLYAPEYWAGRITVGCATYQELGEHVRLSANTVADRVRRLRRDGVLTGFAAVIDEKAWTKHMAAFARARQAAGELILGASRKSRLTAETAFPDAPKGR